MLSIEKSFEALPKLNGAAFISESFALNLYISTPLTNKCSHHYNANLN